jgi:hypothetical protein
VIYGAKVNLSASYKFSSLFFRMPPRHQGNIYSVDVHSELTELTQMMKRIQD